MPNRILIENTRRPHRELWDGQFATTQVIGQTDGQANRQTYRRSALNGKGSAITANGLNERTNG